jgi:hypothetical protein
MDIFKITERSFAMDDEVWAHHANPWSVWTRYTTLPLIIIAIIGRRSTISKLAVLGKTNFILWVNINPPVTY